MLLLDITTFDPENSRELFKRWEKAESIISQSGLKIVNQWFDAGGGRMITLYDVESVKDYMTYNLPVADLCQVEVFPVVEAEEFKNFISKCREKLSIMESFPCNVNSDTI